MRYMLLIANDGKSPQSPTQINATPDFTTWMKALAATGQSRGRFLLRPPDEAVTVRVRNGEQLRSDGPFTETKEQIAGYDILDCDDLDQALEIAVKHPVAKFGAIEVRPDMGVTPWT
jgi:hypothetical protein